MVILRHAQPAVYIFENPEAQRVKVGVSMNDTGGRLNTLNDKWRERTVTCQICGEKRLASFGNLIHRHYVSGISCPGGNNLPFERDVTVAESYLEEMKNSLSELSGVEKNSTVRRIHTLEKRIEKFRHYTPPVGKWRIGAIYYTEGYEAIEKGAHKILVEYLDKTAPTGEVFCCSVSVATEAVETALSLLGLSHSVIKETQ